jgi:alpha-L-fucosidase 2
MEWMGEKPALEKSNHRHTSHLFAVYPGRQISRERTPELAEAAKISLQARGSTGDSRRSWTWPWRTALWARFGEPEKCHEMIRGLFQYNMLNNMITTHPPLQLDGSFGITAGICEMLMQSHTGSIVLLPALPKAWADGHVTGLRARGGYTVELAWKVGTLESVRITASVAGTCTLQYGTQTTSLAFKAGESKTLSGSW